MSDSYDQARIDRENARMQRESDIADAYKVISQALNRGDDKAVFAAVRTEHSTLLGKLGNVVMEAIGEREGDGRLCDFNATCSEQATRDNDRRVSDVRQRFI